VYNLWYSLPNLLCFSGYRSVGRVIGAEGCKDKCKVVPVLFLTERHAMKAYLGSGGIVPLILFGLRH
jgi:hypothetical protein